MKVAICGKSGLVGSKLEAFFSARHDEVVGVKIRHDTPVEEIAKTLNGVSLLINLSGVSILARWNETYKQLLYESRIQSSKKLVQAMGMLEQRPELFLNASAVGIYANGQQHGDGSKAYENDFLSKVCQDWEAEALAAQTLGVRTAVMRFGVVFAKEGGALQKMLPPFKMGVGGKVGRGNQMVSWIHIDDLVNAVDYIFKHPSICGPVNFCAPYPLSNNAQTRIMGRLLNRPTLFTVPAFVLKLIFGEGAAVLLDSKEVYPTLLLEGGFHFEYPNFEQAFSHLIQ